jgi:hypothetical protein
MTQSSPHMPTRELAGQLVDQIGEFVSLEARLLRAELSESTTRLVSSFGYLASGFCVLLAALVILLGAAAAFLMRLTVAPDVACLIVAVAAIAIGAVLVISGSRSLRAASLVPTRSLRQVSLLGEVIKGR